MTTPRHAPVLLALAAALASGCSASPGSIAAGGKGGKGGTMGGGGAAGLGGATSGADAAARDGGSPPGDGSQREAVQSNLSADAPTYKRDACAGCTGGSVGGQSGAAGSAGGSGNSGGGGASSGMGGTTNKGGGMGSGGATGAGGAMGTGGTGKQPDGGLTYDAPTASDASSADLSTSSDAGVAQWDAGPDASRLPDALVADLKPADSLPPDTEPRCVAQIESLVPATDSFRDFSLVAGPNVRVVLRARVVSGGPAAGASWTWQANRDGAPVPAAPGAHDPASAAFFLTDGGNYSFTASDKTGACSVTVQNNVAPADLCLECGHNLNLRFAPSPSTNIPVQSGYFKLAGNSPFEQETLVLSSGVPVRVAPSVGSALVASYVRINASGGDLVVDGLSDPTAGGFSTHLLAASYSGGVLKYDVLVVPIDGSNSGTTGTAAPQLFQNLTPANINTASFRLSGGVSVTGSTLNSSHQGVADVRVMLSNQNPAAVPQPSKLVFSSVGRSDAQGKFSLHAQPGTYWVSISPPVGGGLPDAVAPTAVSLTVDTTIDFTWDAVSVASLTLNVLDAAEKPSAGTRVRLTSAQANKVGTLAPASFGAQSANGDVQIEGTTSATGSVTFDNLPDGATYDALLVPSALGLHSATTSISLTLPAGGGTQTVYLSAQGRISGQLMSGAGSTPVDWTHVGVIAYDRSNDTPEVPLAVAANPDGTFSMGVSPGRIYVLQVVPDASTGLARTFVGPGPMQATEFTFTQRVQAAMPWSSTVMDDLQNGLPGTAMQVFCIVNWPYCVDPTIPLAETTSGDGGDFQLALPDPATR
jgi:hypothetical protein